MSITFRMDHGAKDKFVNGSGGELRKDVRAMFAVWSELVTMDMVRDTAAYGYIDQEWVDMFTERTRTIVMSEIKPAISGLVVEAGSEAVGKLNRLIRKEYPITFESKQMRFSATQRLIDWIDKESLFYVRDMVVAQLEVIRSGMERLVNGGTPLNRIYNYVLDSISLHPKEADFLYRFRQGLIDGGLKPDQVDKKTHRRAVKLKRVRIERIVRTETGRAYGKGYAETVQQAIDGGIVKGALKRWAAVMDARTRDRHVAMDGETVGMDEPYSSGDMFAGETDVNCRCVDEYILD